MNWEAIAAIGQMLGALGVIATLGYLAFQIRQNTQQLERNERTSRAGVVNFSSTAMRENRRVSGERRRFGPATPVTDVGSH